MAGLVGTLKFRNKDGTDPDRKSLKGIKPGSPTKSTLDGENKAESFGEDIGEGVERASATIFSGPGM